MFQIDSMVDAHNDLCQQPVSPTQDLVKPHPLPSPGPGLQNKGPCHEGGGHEGGAGAEPASRAGEAGEAGGQAGLPDRCHSWRCWRQGTILTQETASPGQTSTCSTWWICSRATPLTTRLAAGSPVLLPMLFGSC